MNKPAIAILATLVGTVGLVSPASAGKPQAPKKIEKLKKPNCGESLKLGARHAAIPTGDTTTLVVKKSLSDQQVGQVIHAKLGDVQYCWNRLPDKQRKTDATAVLKLEIDPTGEVQTVDVDGLVSPEAQRCIAVAAAKWQFPVADIAGQFEYAVALRAM